MKGSVLIFAIFIVHLAMSIKGENSTVTSCVIGGKPAECVFYYQCGDDNKTITDGNGLIEPRFGEEDCGDKKVCCLVPKDIGKRVNSGGMKSSNLNNTFKYFVTMIILICAWDNYKNIL